MIQTPSIRTSTVNFLSLTILLLIFKIRELIKVLNFLINLKWVNIKILTECGCLVFPDPLLKYGKLRAYIIPKTV